MGKDVITKPSSGEIYPGIDIISFGSPVEKIKENAKKLSKGSEPHIPEITEVGKTILTKKNGNIIRFNPITKKPFKSVEKSGVVKSVVSSTNVKSILEKLFDRKYASKREER